MYVEAGHFDVGFRIRCMASSHVDFSTVYELNAWVKRCYCSVDEKVRSQHLVQVNLVTGRRRRVVGERGNGFSST
jgi:hypothetical protein